MNSRLIHEAGGQRTFVLVFDTGDEVMEALGAFVREHRVGAAQLTGIGAFSDVELGYFDWESKEYRPIPVDEQVELVSLVGDVALDGDEPVVHAHAVVARSNGRTRGGHLLGGHVRPTLELVLTESPAHLRKRKDSESGLALIALGDVEPPGEPSGEANLPPVPEDAANVVGEQARQLLEDASATPRGSTEEGSSFAAGREDTRS